MGGPRWSQKNRLHCALTAAQKLAAWKGLGGTGAGGGAGCYWGVRGRVGASCVGLEARTHSGARARMRALRRRRSGWAPLPRPRRRRTPRPGLGAELPLPPRPHPRHTPTPDRNSRSRGCRALPVAPRHAWCGPCHLRRRHERGLLSDGTCAGLASVPPRRPQRTPARPHPAPRPSGQAPGAPHTVFSFDAFARRTENSWSVNAALRGPASGLRQQQGIGLGGASAGMRPIRDPTSVLPLLATFTVRGRHSQCREKGKGAAPQPHPRKRPFPS